MLLKIIRKFQINIAPSTVLPTPTTISRNTKAQGSSKRRMVVLNKLFMKYITEIMAMGSLGSDILGRGIEISRVSILYASNNRYPVKQFSHCNRVL